MRNLILAGVSAMVLTLGGGGLALAAGTSGQGANNQNPGARGTMEQSQEAAGSAQAGTSSSRDEVMQAQQKLKSEHLYNGKVDGIDGPHTQQALKQFQQKNGLQQTGQLDEETQAKLGISESNQQSGTSMPSSGATGNAQGQPTGQPNSGSGTGQRQ